MGTQIVIPVLVFTGIMLLLAALVLVARDWLELSGSVTINVNEQRILHVNAGEKLLWALAQNGIHLPAACGGRGFCGQCRVSVTNGGGAPLPTEAMHITQQDSAAGVRLACMVKIREALSISVPTSALDVRRWTCTVVSNHSISAYLKELVLELPGHERIDFSAGQYVLVEAPPHRIAFRDLEIADRYHDVWSENGLLELESVTTEPTVRAYSLANSPQQSRHVVLVVRIAPPPATAPPDSAPGRVSSYIFSLKAGDFVDISGPFGEFRANDSEKEMIFIAGGAGIAPIRSIIHDQLEQSSSRKMCLWYGARNLQDLCFEQEFMKLANEHDNFEYHPALSDPRYDEQWTGPVGFVHQVVYDRYLSSHPAPRDAEYYLCGPPLMSTAVLQMLKRIGVDENNIFFDDFGA